MSRFFVVHCVVYNHTATVTMSLRVRTVICYNTAQSGGSRMNHLQLA